MSDWRRDVLTYWFGLKPEQWWKRDPAIDEDIKEQFEQRWAEERRLPVDSFLDDPLTALAAVILFDQFPRNMFRGHAEQFATDHLALAIAKAAIDRHLDEQLQPQERLFLYMPFQHSEELADQKRSLLLFTELGEPEQIKYSRIHHDLIERFGRFPHRNALLGRASRPDEIAGGADKPW